MKKLVQIMVALVFMVAVIANVHYVTKTLTQKEDSTNNVIRAMQLGIGSRSEHHVYGEMYGKKYTVTIKADEKTGIIHTKTSWQ